MAAGIQPIPEPKGYPFIGNIADIDPEFSLQSFIHLSEKLGEIYRLRLPGGNLVVVSTVALVDELCNEEKFRKSPSSVLTELRNGVHDGLFTAHIEEPNWGIAHRILMPAFGPKGIQDMFEEMHDIASQLVLKWARQGPKHRIQVSDDFTRLALDTLALCSMGFRFNNFYSEKEHPFVSAMTGFLAECGRRSQRLPLPSFVYRKQDEKFAADIQILRATAETVLKERASNGAGTDRKDLLTAMMKGRDSQTGFKMSDESIIDNLITFLIAGHETTSGTLSYAMYELLKHPEAYRKVQQEVDEVIGEAPITVEHMHKLPYIEAVLRETLRFDAPIPIVSRNPIHDGTLLAGKYEINKNDTCLMLLSRSHQDPSVFQNPTEFRPERMLSENFNRLPKNAWKPFGSGVRACIGRPFAWQEAVLAMAMIFQNLDFALADPDYVLQHKQSLTIKPKDLYITARLRQHVKPTELSHRLAGSVSILEKTGTHAQDQAADFPENSSSDTLHQMAVLYGSNSGTCELMAQRLASTAPRHGCRVTIIDCLDAAIDRLPQGIPVVIFTSSYEGLPPDNAARFIPWLETLKATEGLSGVKYAVFGSGNTGWPQTFQRVPKAVDEAMSAAGAQRLVEMGFADAASDDVFVVSDTWEDDFLWPAMEAMYPATLPRITQRQTLAMLRAHKAKSRASILGYDMQEAKVLATRILTAKGEPVKQHIDIGLPHTTFFRAGDYLTVLPSNPYETFTRALRRFGMPIDANIVVEGDSTKIPTNSPLPIRSILSDFVELGQPATRRDILALANAAGGIQAADREKLEWLAADGYESNVSLKRTSVLDILETFPDINVPLGDFLNLLPAMRTRQYSISSSPSENLHSVSVTCALLRQPAYSGQGDHMGVASSYLTGLQPGDLLYVSVRAAHEAFHLPANPDTPLIMISAGTGIAPFRGFIQERASMIKSGQNLAKAVLYHGCREPGCDDLYADELNEWESLGAVAVKRTFSRAPEKSNGSQYVQDAVWADRNDLLDLWRQGCFLYVCGSAKVSEAITRLAVTFKRQVVESKGQTMSEAEAQKWWEELRNIRYAFDIFD